MTSTVADKLRRIQPLPNIKVKPRDLGERPQFRWVSPSELWVDEDYQRKLGRASPKLIRKIVEEFSWNKYKPPIVTEVDGRLHCVDGQHTAIGALTRGIPQIPVFVTKMGEFHKRADAFVGHNLDRIKLTPFDVFKGQLKANNPLALDTQRVCDRAGIKLVQQLNLLLVAPEVGETSCVRKIQALVGKHKPMRARMMLQSLVMGNRAPITATEIDAIELLWVADKTLDPERVAIMIKQLGGDAVLKAKMNGTRDRRPQKNVLFEMYMDKLGKKIKK